jgi:integrase
MPQSDSKFFFVLLDAGCQSAEGCEGFVRRLESLNRHQQMQPGRLAGNDVARIVKKLAERAGLDAAKYAGHSLRAGHATSAAIAGASERSIMNQTGHRSVQMVRRYIRDGSLFRKRAPESWVCEGDRTNSETLGVERVTPKWE